MSMLVLVCLKVQFLDLYFFCHINDLPERVNSQIRLFADDCLMYRTINSPQDHQTLKRDPFSLQIWADDWGMKFNAQKCYLPSNFKDSMTETYEISYSRDRRDVTALATQVNKCTAVM